MIYDLPTTAQTGFLELLEFWMGALGTWRSIVSSLLHHGNLEKRKIPKFGGFTWSLTQEAFPRLPESVFHMRPEKRASRQRDVRFTHTLGCCGWLRKYHGFTCLMFLGIRFFFHRTTKKGSGVYEILPSSVANNNLSVRSAVRAILGQKRFLWCQTLMCTLAHSQQKWEGSVT